MNKQLTPELELRLEKLKNIVEMCKEESKLLLIYCEDTELQKILAGNLEELCSIETVDIDNRINLHDLLYLEFSYSRKGRKAVQVLGLDCVTELKALAVGLNWDSDNFTKFKFPILIWINQEVQKELILTAPHFYGRVPTFSFL